MKKSSLPLSVWIIFTLLSAHLSFSDENPVINQDDPGANAAQSAPIDGNPGDSTAPAEQEKPQELDQAFLLLPSFDLERQYEKGSPSDQTQTRVGDRVGFKLQGDLKSLTSPMNVTLPQGTQDISTTVEIGDEVKADQWILYVTPVKAGRVTVPSLALVDASGKAIARTNPISFDATTSIKKDDPKPKEAEPAQPPTSLGFPTTTVAILAGIVLLLAGLGIFYLVRWRRKRKPKTSKKPKGPIKTEDEIAIDALNALDAKGLLKSGGFKQYYFGVSEILKHYAASRYKFDAAESTTEEMLTHLERESGVQETILQLLKEMFEKLDRVKFTDYRPIPIEGIELMSQAKRVIQTTKRVPQIAIPQVVGSSIKKGGSA